MGDYRDDPLAKGAVRALEQQIEDTAAFINRAELSLAQPAGSGSSRAETSSWASEIAKGDPDTAAAIKELLDAGISDVARLLTSALDHAYGLRALLKDPHGLLASPYVAARGLLEAVVQSCFILDPYIPPADRVLRMLAYRVATVEGGLATLEAFGKAAEETTRVHTIAGIESLHAWLGDVNFDREPENKNPLASRRIGFRGRWVALDFNVTAAAKQYMPNDSFFWAILSGAAHGRGWFLAGQYGLDGGQSGASLADVATSSTFVALSLSAAIVEVVGRHAGVEYESVLRKTHKRRVLLAALPATGPGLAVSFEDYHARAGRRRTSKPSA